MIANARVFLVIFALGIVAIVLGLGLLLLSPIVAILWHFPSQIKE